MDYVEQADVTIFPNEGLRAFSLVLSHNFLTSFRFLQTKLSKRIKWQFYALFFMFILNNDINKLLSFLVRIGFKLNFPRSRIFPIAFNNASDGSLLCLKKIFP